MKEIILLIAMTMVSYLGMAQNGSEEKLIYCSCAENHYGLPVGEISKIYYELIADEGTEPQVVYAIVRGAGPEKKKYVATAEDVSELQKILADMKVDDLNGYKVDERMTGGTSYRIYMEYSSGKKINATWFTHNPRQEAVIAYNTILRFLSSKAK